MLVLNSCFIFSTGDGRHHVKDGLGSGDPEGRGKERPQPWRQRINGWRLQLAAVLDPPRPLGTAPRDHGKAPGTKYYKTDFAIKQLP